MVTFDELVDRARSVLNPRRLSADAEAGSVSELAGVWIVMDAGSGCGVAAGTSILAVFCV